LKEPSSGLFSFIVFYSKSYLLHFGNNYRFFSEDMNTNIITMLLSEMTSPEMSRVKLTNTTKYIKMNQQHPWIIVKSRSCFALI
jgi:hypothetical protein